MDGLIHGLIFPFGLRLKGDPTLDDLGILVLLFDVLDDVAFSLAEPEVR